MHALIDNLAGNHAEMTAIRRDIHANPELGFEEHRTSDLVAEKLTDWGIEVTRGISQTGLVGTLRVGNDSLGRLARRYGRLTHRRGQHLRALLAPPRRDARLWP